VKVGYHGADMSKPAEIEAMMKYAAQTFGRVDILVNNAGIQHVAPVEDFPPEKLGRDHRHQPVERLPHHAARLPAMKQGQLGPHHQRRLGARPGGLGARSRPTSPPSTASSA
jgi:3-hydroxybutyrate dehydrogenase